MIQRSMNPGLGGMQRVLICESRKDISSLWMKTERSGRQTRRFMPGKFGKRNRHAEDHQRKQTSPQRKHSAAQGYRRSSPGSERCGLLKQEHRNHVSQHPIGEGIKKVNKHGQRKSMHLDHTLYRRNTCQLLRNDPESKRPGRRKERPLWRQLHHYIKRPVHGNVRARGFTSSGIRPI